MKWHPNIEPNSLYIQISKIAINYMYHWSLHHAHRNSCRNDDCHTKFTSSLFKVFSPFVENKNLHPKMLESIEKNNSWSLVIENEENIGIRIQTHPRICLLFKYKSSTQ